MAGCHAGRGAVRMGAEAADRPDEAEAAERRLRQRNPEYARWVEARNRAYDAMVDEARAGTAGSGRVDAAFRKIRRRLAAWDRRHPCPVTADQWEQASAEGGDLPVAVSV